MSFEASDVSVGQIVNWYPDGDKNQEPLPAIVTGVGWDSLCLGVFSKEIHNHLIRDGCRHISDPRTKSNEMRENGGWDHTEQHKQFLDLKARVDRLWEELILGVNRQNDDAPIEKRVGLIDLTYGESRPQLRSASEAV
jgi:hypothetical protein